MLEIVPLGWRGSTKIPYKDSFEGGYQSLSQGTLFIKGSPEGVIEATPDGLLKAFLRGTEHCEKSEDKVSKA